MRNPPPVFWLALLGAAGLWFWSRTEQGEEVVRKVSDTAGEGVERAGEAVQRVIDWALPRGLRNNNPGNIDRKPGVNWRGMSADQSPDPRFIVFDAPEWGIRAMARVIRNYQARGLRSVRQIINTWAPPVENDTGAYVAAVAKALGTTPDAPVTADQMPGLLAAIIKHENGQQPYDAEVILRGIELERTA